MRKKRLDAIRRHILRGEISTQEELQTALLSEGISVSQGTLSRDLELLGIEKSTSPSGGKVYSLPQDSRPPSPRGELRIGRTEGFIGLANAGETLLLNTVEGHATRIASEIEELSAPEVANVFFGPTHIVVIGQKGTTRQALLCAIAPAVPEVLR
ncbi:transcriptional regulator [Porphyromonas gulae]|uniref:Arginine repressor n=1 Tax=Porphyromonas gulae TaxID=111105 RepID=A0A0A2GJ46_9PORP|nr:transcriptional regulator [Porphyromonas gulae]KGN68251.1 transcriptional regulator [Porphyromonas gulae]KGN72727.1 transcriptional regulator [Porphyromonas gulae]KGN74518.1 transcriptional regulator [Porphyromonas gulae]KGN85573.1 transcriptional regulator [Porphyromonas gulae]KGN86956.1 transcriptional regulator [Porphyromonas gulae]